MSGEGIFQKIWIWGFVIYKEKVFWYVHSELKLYKKADLTYKNQLLVLTICKLIQQHNRARWRSTTSLDQKKSTIVIVIILLKQSVFNTEDSCLILFTPMLKLLYITVKQKFIVFCFNDIIWCTLKDGQNIQR